MFGAFTASGVSNGPGSQMSSRMLAIFQEGRAEGIAGVIGADSTLVEGSEPIRLQVIPYQVRNQEIPVLPFLLPPPPLLLEPAKPKKRRRNSGRHQVWEDDFDWLMD